MENQHSPGPGRGAINIIQRIASLSINIIETRLRLLAVELEEEKENLINLLLMSGLALIFLAFGLISLLILICWTIDPAYRFAALAALTTILFCTALALFLVIKRKLSSQRFLEETRKNLKLDRELLEKDE